MELLKIYLNLFLACLLYECIPVYSAPPIHLKLESFTFELYSIMSKNLTDTDNMVFSPISIFSALNVLGQAADSNSFAQISAALHGTRFSHAQKFIKQTFSSSNSYNLTMAQRIFADSSLPLKAGFQEVLQKSGLHSIKEVDFRGQPEAVRNLINTWVRHNTLDQIKELLESNQVTSMTRLYIVNALALEAPWVDRFEETDKNGVFNISPNKQIHTAMMSGSDRMCMTSNTAYMRSYARYTGVSFIDATFLVMPFEGDKLTFIAIMPNKAGDFGQVNSVAGLKKAMKRVERFWERSWRGRLYYSMCEVTMPKFELSYDYDRLKGDLIELGVSDVFDEHEADLSRLYSGKEELYVTDAVHKATFSLDEGGVKASAATGFGISARMLPERVTLNKPFLFFVRNQDTGAILFMGKVVNPKNS